MVGVYAREGLMYVSDQKHSEALALGYSLASCVCVLRVSEHPTYCPSQMRLRGS